MRGTYVLIDPHTTLQALPEGPYDIDIDAIVLWQVKQL